MSIRYTAEQLQRKFPGPAGSPGYARVADALRVEGRLEEAVGICREGLRARPLVAGYVVLGKSLAESGRLEEAREQFEAALRLDARCLSAMHALAEIMGKLQWSDAAAGYYRSILDVEPWDREIRDLLQGAPPAPSAPAHAAAIAPAPAREEETFVKPDGFEGDVMEVNLNDMADEFLPSGNDAAGAALEDALAAGTREAPAEDFSPAPDPAAEPGADLGPTQRVGKPQDILAASQPPETAEPESPAPISGSDVEERLDSLFGSETTGMPSATATWTAAPAVPDGSATAAELRGLADSRFEEAGPAEPSGLYGTAEPGPPVPPAAEGDFASAGTAETLPESDRVQGSDIERRLDELFNLGGEEERPKPAAALSASDLPVAPAPHIGETVILGEAVSFGEGPAYAGADAAAAPAQGEIVTGQDVADKLDSLLGPEPQAKAAPAPDPDPALPELPAARASAAAEATAWGDPAPPQGRAESAPAGPEAEPLLTTESMLPSAWEDGPRVTGADVEAQLDKLFDLEAPAGRPAAPEAQGNLEGTVTFEAPKVQDGGPHAGEQARLRESVADWLARREEPEAGPGPGDTLILPNGAMDLAGSDAPPAAERADEDAFGTLAPEEIASLSETASIEMIDGGDVAERLDKLFEAAPGQGPEIVPFPAGDPAQEEASLPEPDAGATLEVPLPGRFAEAQEDERAAESAEIGSGPAETSGIGQTPAPALAPMTDEEEGYPEEEDMPGQGAGANVATVTLAEIYFQQGLREQALQIYRQLSEREPENESVRKRIAEIEATRADAEQPGQGADPRRPRPGLKVPKRKK